MLVVEGAKVLAVVLTAGGAVEESAAAQIATRTPASRAAVGAARAVPGLRAAVAGVVGAVGVVTALLVAASSTVMMAPAVGECAACPGNMGATANSSAMADLLACSSSSKPSHNAQIQHAAYICSSTNTHTHTHTHTTPGAATRLRSAVVAAGATGAPTAMRREWPVLGDRGWCSGSSQSHVLGFQHQLWFASPHSPTFAFKPPSPNPPFPPKHTQTQ